MNKRVLVFDIETSPILAYVWGLRDENIGLNQIHTDWRVLAFSAKWYQSSKTIYREARTASQERKLLLEMRDLLDKADYVITQNGKNFDSLKLNARFIERGIKPPSPYKHIDTYQIASKVAKFTSNKLEYLTEKLCTKYKKLSHKRFPGFSLWDACLSGNKSAWAEMRRYNIHDVLSTEELFTKLLPWESTGRQKLIAKADRQALGLIQ